MRPTLRAALALVVALPLGAQTPVPLARRPRVEQALELLQRWLDGERAYERIPGVSAAVVHDQDVLWSGGFGLADVARKTPASASTQYGICSISKVFTSVAAMQLRDAGKLRLDDSVAAHLPWFRMRQAYADSPPITVEGLLTHAAGLPREADFPYWTRDFRFPTHDELVAKLAGQETLYPAERYFQYSNLGLTLVGEIVARESGLPYTEYVRRNVVRPLGLASTTPDLREARAGGRLATGYSAMTRDGARTTIPFYSAEGIAPAAGFASTADDLARFAAWQFRLLGGGRAEVLAPNTLREMERVHFVDPSGAPTWGLGLRVAREGATTFVEHGGSCPGYQTYFLTQPDAKVAAVFLSNANGVDPRAFARRMYDIVAPAIAASLGDSLAPAAAPDATLRAYAGSYDDQPWGGETIVVPWADGLAMVPLPSRDPMHDMTRLRAVPGAPGTFRVVRDDGSLAEPIRFEMGPDGRAVRFWHFENPSERVPAVADPTPAR